jgi:hypothetical protein
MKDVRSEALQRGRLDGCDERRTALGMITSTW